MDPWRIPFEIPPLNDVTARLFCTQDCVDCGSEMFEVLFIELRETCRFPDVRDLFHLESFPNKLLNKGYGIVNF